MESKIIVIVAAVLANLAQISSTQSSAVSFFLSDDAAAGLNRMESNQASTLQSKFDAFNPIFDIIRKLAAEQVLGDKPSPDYDASVIVAKALSRVKDAIDTSLDTILIAAGKGACHGVRVARKATFRDVEDICTVVTEAILLAGSSNSSTEAVFGNKIKAYRTAVHADVTDFVGYIYDAVRSCTGATSTDELDVIRIAQNGSGLALHRFCESIFNAIVLYGNAIVTHGSDMNVVYQIDQEKRNGEFDLMSDVENKFSGLKALYINSHLKKTGLIAELNKNRYAHSVSSNRFQSSVEALFSRIDAHLAGKRLGMRYSGEDDLTPDDAARFYSVAKWLAATNQILNSINSENAGEELSTIVDDVASKFASQLDIAKVASNHREAVRQISSLNEEASVLLEKYIGIIFKPFLNGKNRSDGVVAELQTLRSNADAKVKVFAGNLSKAYAKLAEVLSGNVDTDVAEIIECVIDLKSESILAMRNVSEIISAAGIIGLING